jgi:hypothetical protein
VDRLEADKRRLFAEHTRVDSERLLIVIHSRMTAIVHTPYNRCGGDSCDPFLGMLSWFDVPLV